MADKRTTRSKQAETPVQDVQGGDESPFDTRHGAGSSCRTTRPIRATGS